MFNETGWRSANTSSNTFAESGIKLMLPFPWRGAVEMSKSKESRKRNLLTKKTDANWHNHLKVKKSCWSMMQLKWSKRHIGLWMLLLDTVWYRFLKRWNGKVRFICNPRWTIRKSMTMTDNRWFLSECRWTTCYLWNLISISILF